MSITLYEHNKETYQKMNDMFKKRNRVGVVQPTGTGKSFIFLKWIEDNPSKSFLILSPSTEIFRQLAKYAADNLVSLNNVAMCTYQALLFVDESDIKNKKADCIILDEFHRTGAEKWGAALDVLLEANSAAKILGTSATPIRYLDDAKDMALELFDRNLAKEMMLGEAVAKGILPTPTYVPVWYDFDDTFEKCQDTINNVTDKKKQEELQHQLSEAKNHIESSYGASNIFEKHMKHNGKYIVFCRDIEHLYEMIPLMKNWCFNVSKDINHYVSIGERKDKHSQLQKFASDNSDALKLLFAVDRLNEGVHVKDIDGIIMLRPTTSPIIYLQQMGRALASDHDDPIIFDMVNNYQNVQVPLPTGEFQNVFVREFQEASERFSSNLPFSVFEEMIYFNQVLDELESLLYFDNDEVWMQKFETYKQFKEEYSREPEEREIYNGIRIGYWMYTQKSVFKKGCMLKHREQLLHDAGFLFSNRFDEQWFDTFELYKTFKEQYHRDPLPREVFNNVEIGRWLGTQKSRFNNGTLEKRREQLLRESGFCFPDIKEKKWLSMLELYKTFKSEYNREPKRRELYHNKYIGIWFFGQKKMFKQGKLSKEREQLLRDTDFPFSDLSETKEFES